MDLQQPSMPDLFAQLGMASEEQQIDRFFASHQLDNETTVVEADFLASHQKIVLLQMRLEDGQWAEVVDEMDARLHH